jgi:hypothetical protein
MTEEEEKDILKMHNFKRELATLLNRYSLDSATNTPDYILAEYLLNSLMAYDVVLRDIATHRGV